MKPLPILLCAAAGLTGWWSAASWEKTEWTNRTGTTTSAAESLPSLASFSSSTSDTVREPRGSIGLSGLPAQLDALGFDKALDLAYELPEGPARAVAFALLEVRRLPGDDPFADPFSEAKEEPEENPLAELAKKLAAGEKVTDHTDHSALLKRWAQSDPAAACAAILQMPAGESRTAAADEAAGALAKIDPDRAMGLVLQAGGEKFGQGAARAWAELVLFPPQESSEGKDDRWFLDRMHPAQQDSLFKALAEEVKRGSYVDEPGTFSLPGGQGYTLDQLAWAVLQTGEPSPGMEAFFIALAGFPDAADRLQRSVLNVTIPSAGHCRVAEILAAERVANLNPGEEATLLQEFFPHEPVRYPFRPEIAATLHRAAPRLLPNLARSGHVEEAVHLLDIIEDRTVWRESFAAMLPYWMDADPAKARAAFENAPLTALERERCERHPAFLLNP